MSGLGRRARGRFSFSSAGWRNPVMQTARMSPIRPRGRIDERPIAVYVAGHDQNRTVICIGRF